jgi:CHASE3 domain sensor protein
MNIFTFTILILLLIVTTTIIYILHKKMNQLYTTLTEITTLERQMVSALTKLAHGAQQNLGRQLETAPERIWLNSPTWAPILAIQNPNHADPNSETFINALKNATTTLDTERQISIIEPTCQRWFEDEAEPLIILLQQYSERYNDLVLMFELDKVFALALKADAKTVTAN